MKTITLPADGTDNFNMNIEVNFNVRTAKNLIASDGVTVKLEGKTVPYLFNDPADQTDAAKAARATMQASIESAFATYWSAVNVPVAA